MFFPALFLFSFPPSLLPPLDVCWTKLNPSRSSTSPSRKFEILLIQATSLKSIQKPCCWKKCSLYQTVTQFFWDEFGVLSQAHSPATDISSELRGPQHRQPHPLSSSAVNSVIRVYQEARGLGAKEMQMAGIPKAGPPRALLASAVLRIARVAFNS